ncbi:sulfurtransferase [Glaciihabitans arcticus]|uniref:Sulfurtransferase n=1 Tax=Glaciihabitans arcticus TaxID=2668039 RepID=A0A4Q9GRC7_9MICO|nr:rhodanese-like domain-containing protein [Glaciihabitans arcticus]TBN57496.1 sulfurtransferase [Glaciihabitans arcticus]
MTVSSPLVSTQWLADHLGADNLVVLDATVVPSVLPSGKPTYLSGFDKYLLNGHLPGAVFADLLDVFSDPTGAFPFTRPDAELFAAAAGSVGVSNETTVVIYDSAVGQWASRVWWLFRAFGYDNVAVLDGGLTKWTTEERETDVGHVEPVPAVFTASERPDLWVDKAFVEGVVAGTENAGLVCGLPPQEFSGEAGHRARLGHIPGSISAPAGRLVDRASNALLGEDALRSTFAPVLTEPRIVVYCAAGIAATSDALALTLLGHNNVAVYDGSLSEWVADAAAPVVASA